MIAAWYDRQGPAAEVLQVGDLPATEPGPGEVRVAAVVHHGGAGTTTAVARAGAPQVVIPQRYDQPYWARRVGHPGIGVAHAHGMPAADSLATALCHALEPDVAARALSIAAPCAPAAHRSQHVA